VHERVLGPEHRLVGKAHLEIAKVSFQKANLSGSTDDLGSTIKDLQRAYDIYEPVYGANHVKLADIYSLSGAVAYLQKCPGVALAWYERALSMQQATWKDPGRIDFGYTWANIAEARLDLGDHEGARVAIQEAEKTHARSEIEGFIKDLRNRLENERDTRSSQPAPAPEHCEKSLLVLKKSSEGP
jgi:tetratricopeptide (TPR) repeat protein